MAEIFRRLALGLFLIAAASALLLYSDLGSRVQTGAPTNDQRPMRVALLQHASQAILDQGRDGMLAGLSEKGWIEGQNLIFRRFNAEGDTTVSQAIAREMVNGGNDLLMTISTPSLQAVANANRNQRVPHIFGLVADPASTGVGISRENPLDHPAWMAGYGTMQPVALAFETARKLNPQLRSVGVVWNAGEANAEAQVRLARQVCAGLGIQLVETTVDSSAAVGEAAAALVARGIDAVWVCGDVTVITAIDSVIAAARRARIPVFTVIPPNVKRGALFDVGADYFEVGRLTGQLAGDVLNGRSPAEIPVTNVMPEMMTVNLQAAADLRDRWVIPEDFVQKATLVIEADGSERARPAAQATPTPKPQTRAPAKKWRIAIVVYNENPPTEETLEGMKDGWARSGLVAGRDYEVKMRSAQGDIAALGGILDAALTEGADMVVPISTPALQAAMRRVKNIPIVFSLVADPVIAGAGKSFTDHPANITGVAVLGPVPEMLDLLEKYFPQYKRLGTLFCPAETNSVALKEHLEKLCKERGFTLETVAANSASELPESALALMSRPIDAVVQISDNLSSSGFTAITRAARQARKPLLSMNSTTVPLGAAVAIGRDYHYCGEVTVEMVTRIIRGENPAQIPFVLPPKVVLTVSPANAAACGMTLPPGLLQSAKVSQ